MSGTGAEQAEKDATAVAGSTVACDGDGADGHPRVFLNLGEAGEAACPYCGRRFRRESKRKP